MGKVNNAVFAMKRELLQGKYTPGERMPGVADVEARFDMSTPSAVKAMQVLVGEGLVLSRHGVGYFASPPEAAVEDDGLDEWDLMAARDALATAAEAIIIAQSNVDRLLRNRS